MLEKFAFDARWIGQHGIGRFAFETSKRIEFGHLYKSEKNPAAPLSSIYLGKWFKTSKAEVLFSPGYIPPIFVKKPFCFTIHDLNHLDLPYNSSPLKRAFYQTVIKPAIKSSFKVLTVSEFSKKRIIEWTNCPADKIEVVSNGTSSNFTPFAKPQKYNTPYIFCCSNRKGHKNEKRLFQAFSQCSAKSDLSLVMTGEADSETTLILNHLKLDGRVYFTGKLSEENLASWYRGAVASIFPSIYEGFGLPVIESMAVGTPAIIANAASLPEVGGTAAYYFDPFDIDSISQAIDTVTYDELLKKTMSSSGLAQAKNFSWDRTAALVSNALTSLHC